MAKKLLAVILGVSWLAAGLSATATAEELSNSELTRRVKELEERRGLGNVAPAWMDRLALSGLLEAEAGYASLEDENESDAALATMELGLDAAVNDYVSGHFLLLWEEDDTEPVDLDEGFLTLTGGPDCPASVSAGKMYVPFGRFESHMISDPLTLELAETRESAVMLGVEEKGFYGSVYLFNGDADEFDEDSHVDNYGAQAGFAMATEAFDLDIGGSYINTITDSDGWEGLFDDLEDERGVGVELDDYVGGLGAHAILNTGPFMFIVEYITALAEADFVNRKDGSTLATVDEISAWNAELGYFFDLGGKPATAAVGYQGSDDAGDFLPETRLLGSIGVEIYEATSLAFEYFHEEFENDDEADVVTAQLAVEF
jgi:hypothetical protein